MRLNRFACWYGLKVEHSINAASNDVRLLRRKADSVKPFRTQFLRRLIIVVARLPKPHHAVVANRDKLSTIRRELQVVHWVLAITQEMLSFAFLKVPDPNALILTGRCEPAPVT